jgi:hypothetical protein
MRIKRDLYERHEALSPIYQGWSVNPLPMLYTIFQEQGLEDDVLDEVLHSVRDTLGLFELSDPTYPVSDAEQEYVNKTSYYLGELHDKGTDIVLGTFLTDKEATIASMEFLLLARLGYAKRSENDMLVAQALAFYDVFSMTYSLRGSTVAKDQFGVSMEALQLAVSKAEDFSLDQTVMDQFDQLANDVNVQNTLFIDRNIGSEPINWLTYLLQDYMATANPQALHGIIGLYAFHQLEEYLPDTGSLLSQWMLASELYLATHETASKLKDTALIDWDTMLANIHLSDHVNQVVVLHALYELYRLYDLNECQVIASYIYTNLG